MPTLFPPVASPVSPISDWVRLPAGSFQMGGLETDKFVSAVELPRHEVTFTRAFQMMPHPVTRAQWLQLMPAPNGQDQHLASDLPIVGISWDDAMDYCRRLSDATGLFHRLPSEAEWEYACRAGSSHVFAAQNDLTPADANYSYDERGHPVGPGRLLPIGHFPANAWGLHDLLGNVCEWVADRWHPSYHGAPIDGSAWFDDAPSETRRTLRGGAWDHLPRVLRCSWRDWAPASARWDNLGFRLVREDTAP